MQQLPEVEQTIQEAINHKENTYTHYYNIPYIEKFDSPGNLPKIITDIISKKNLYDLYNLNNVLCN